MSDSRADNNEKHSETPSTPESDKSFPTNAVVGIIDDPEQLSRVVDELHDAGFEPDVLCGARGVERIESAGGSTMNVKLTRAVQGLFGYETEHTRRHTEALEAGDFVVLVGSEDDATTDRIRNVFAAHGGHFVNYYSRWTSRDLIP